MVARLTSGDLVLSPQACAEILRKRAWYHSHHDCLLEALQDGLCATVIDNAEPEVSDAPYVHLNMTCLNSEYFWLSDHFKCNVSCMSLPSFILHAQCMHLIHICYGSLDLKDALAPMLLNL